MVPFLSPNHRTEFCRSLELCFTQGSEACQASALAVLQFLCDPRRSLHGDKTTADAAVRLADGLPPRDTLAEIMNLLLNPFTCELRTHFSIQLLTMRTFVLLATYGGDPAFVVLRECLAAKHRTLFAFLRKLAADFDGGASAACRGCLGATLDFLGLLLAPPPSPSVDNDDDASLDASSQPAARLPQRTLYLTPAELAWVVLWPPSGGEANTAAESADQAAVERRRTHPLTLLQVRLTEVVVGKEEEKQAAEETMEVDGLEEEAGPLHELRQLKVSKLSGYFIFYLRFSFS
jgi:hypothetical protein